MLSFFSTRPRSTHTHTHIRQPKHIYRNEQIKVAIPWRKFHLLFESRDYYGARTSHGHTPWPSVSRTRTVLHISKSTDRVVMWRRGDVAIWPPTTMTVLSFASTSPSMFNHYIHSHRTNIEKANLSVFIWYDCDTQYKVAVHVVSPTRTHRTHTHRSTINWCEW